MNMMDEDKRIGRDDPLPSQSLCLDELSFTDPSVIVMDELVFYQPMCQRVYQYLRRHMDGYNLDSFSFTNDVEGSKKNCLEIFLQ